VGYRCKAIRAQPVAAAAENGLVKLVRGRHRTATRRLSKRVILAWASVPECSLRRLALPLLVARLA